MADLGGTGCTAFSTAADNQVRGGGPLTLAPAPALTLTLTLTDDQVRGGGLLTLAPAPALALTLTDDQVRGGSVRSRLPSLSGESALGGGGSYTTHVWVSPAAGVPLPMEAFCTLGADASCRVSLLV